MLEIQGRELEDKHIGSKVTYIPTYAKGDVNHEDAEGGTISSWNHKYVFVNYGTGTNKATRPEDLVWG